MSKFLEARILTSILDALIHRDDELYLKLNDEYLHLETKTHSPYYNYFFSYPNSEGVSIIGLCLPDDSFLRETAKNLNLTNYIWFGANSDPVMLLDPGTFAEILQNRQYEHIRRIETHQVM